MTERQLFLAIGEVDATMVASATPFKQKRPVYGWMLAAAAAVVVGVLGYAGLMNAWRDTPPVEPVTPTTAVTTTTTTTTNNPQTPTTAPDGLPLLTNDGRIDATTEGAGMTPEITAFSLDELAIDSITEAPLALPVYTVDFEKFDEEEELQTIIERYVSLTGDTLTAPIAFSEYGGLPQAEGEKFRYSILPPEEYLGTHNSIGLWLQQPLAMGDTEGWLQQVLSHAPQLFAHMQKPTLRLVNGNRDRLWPGSGGWTAADAVTFRAYVYDAATEDEAARWLNSVSLYVFEGELQAYTVYLTEHYEAMGNYPIMSVAEAKATVQRMCEEADGDWINDEVEILSVELQYIPDSMSRLRVPFYRLLLAADETELGQEIYERTGMTMFYEEYICAVPTAYWTSETDDMLTTQR